MRTDALYLDAKKSAEAQGVDFDLIRMPEFDMVCMIVLYDKLLAIEAKLDGTKDNKRRR